MKVDKLYIERNAGVRPLGNVDIVGFTWFVERGQKYDLVSFTIKEFSGYVWYKKICVRCGYEEDKCMRLAQLFAKHIKPQELKYMKDMVEDFKRYGCD